MPGTRVIRYACFYSFDQEQQIILLPSIMGKRLNSRNSTLLNFRIRRIPYGRVNAKRIQLGQA